MKDFLFARPWKSKAVFNFTIGTYLFFLVMLFSWGFLAGQKFLNHSPHVTELALGLNFFQAFCLVIFCPCVFVYTAFGLYLIRKGGTAAPQESAFPPYQPSHVDRLNTDRRHCRKVARVLYLASLDLHLQELREWLADATFTLCKEAKNRVRQEIHGHYQEGVELYITAGLSFGAAHRKVMEELGSAQSANAAFCKTYLTSWQENVRAKFVKKSIGVKEAGVYSDYLFLLLLMSALQSLVHIPGKRALVVNLLWVILGGMIPYLIYLLLMRKWKKRFGKGPVLSFSNYLHDRSQQLMVCFIALVLGAHCTLWYLLERLYISSDIARFPPYAASFWVIHHAVKDRLFVLRWRNTRLQKGFTIGYLALLFLAICYASANFLATFHIFNLPWISASGFDYALFWELVAISSMAAFFHIVRGMYVLQKYGRNGTVIPAPEQERVSDMNRPGCA